MDSPLESHRCFRFLPSRSLLARLLPLLGKGLERKVNEIINNPFTFHMLRKRPRSLHSSAKRLGFMIPPGGGGRGGINGDNIEFTISYTGVERRLGDVRKQTTQPRPEKKRSIEAEKRTEKFPFYTHEDNKNCWRSYFSVV